MSIEQTNQLLLLILNSTLMAMLSAGLLGGAGLRLRSLSGQVNRVQRRYQQMMHHLEQDDISVDRARLTVALKKNRGDRQRLSNQYLWSRLGMLLFHGALLVFGMSLLALALRSLLSFDKLVSIALVLFTLGAAGLLTGIGCTLRDFVQGSRDDNLNCGPLVKARHRFSKKSSDSALHTLLPSSFVF